MEIVINKKAQILLKEGTGAMLAYGRDIVGYIKEVAEVAQKQIENLQRKTEKLLFIVDEYGERALIPCEEVKGINYLKD